MNWSWTLPQIYKQQIFFAPFLDVLFEKDKTKANPTPSQLGKGAPHEESVKGD